VEETTTTIVEEETTEQFSPVLPTFNVGGGSTFAVPDETDDSSFFDHGIGTSPPQALYPEFHHDGKDDTFGL
jgi:hypothetical protein